MVELFPAIRYPADLPAVVVEPGESITEVARDGNVVILLQPGTYDENVELRGNNVFVFGTCSEDEGLETVIQGSVAALGNTV